MSIGWSPSTSTTSWPSGNDSFLFSFGDNATNYCHRCQPPTIRRWWSMRPAPASPWLTTIEVLNLSQFFVHDGSPYINIYNPEI